MVRLKPEGLTSCSRCLRGKRERTFRQIDKKVRLFYGHIFLVTFSTPLHFSKKVADSLLETPERESVRSIVCQPASTW